MRTRRRAGGGAEGGQKGGKLVSGGVIRFGTWRGQRKAAVVKRTPWLNGEGVQHRGEVAVATTFSNSPGAVEESRGGYR